MHRVDGAEGPRQRAIRTSKKNGSFRSRLRKPCSQILKTHRPDHFVLHPIARERIARQYRAEGEEQALRIRAEADRQREEILSTAYKEAERIKGEGDAESARVYGVAYSRNPRFYKLIRTLESYKKIFDDKTTAILSSDSELLRVLMRGEGGVQ